MGKTKIHGDNNKGPRCIHGSPIDISLGVMISLKIFGFDSDHNVLQ